MCANITVQEDVLRRFRPSLRVALDQEMITPLRSCGWNATDWKLVSGRAQGGLGSGFLCNAQGSRFRIATAWQQVLCSTV